MRRSGGALLGLLLRSTGPAPVLPPGQIHRGRELLLMVWPSLLNPVFGEPADILSGHLLEEGLVVSVPLAPDVGRHARPEQPLDEFPGGLEPPIQVDGAEHRLKGVSQDARLVPSSRLLLAPSQPHGIAQSQLTSHL